MPRIVEGLRTHGIETTVYALSMRDGLAIKRLEAAGVDWVCAPYAKTAHIKAARWLKKELERNPPDAIWTSLTQATLLGQRVGKRLKIPVISWQHNAFLKPINRWLLRRQCRLSKFWVADSQSVLDFAVENIGLSPSDIRILPLYVANPSAPQATSVSDGMFRWVSVGRLHPNKNHAALIEALAPLKMRSDWSLEIAGDGAERAQLEDSIARFGLSAHITLKGHLENIPRFLATAHGYVQPSRNEGLCIAAHEAMTAGLPCVVTATGQMPQTLYGSPAVVPIGDAAAVVSQMMAIMDDPALRQHLATLSRDRVLLNFAPERFDEALADIATRLTAFV
ncbi:glycosyl transferase [Algimonas arctica]|uniref:Glycosyl transferase n=1 Tax=Algimonas arctica TaxID=1479486 RepID=A0A8J3G141_9PROT|nr:glycosyl transferase [Algimonas arctica]